MADTIKITTLAQLKVALQAAKTYIDGQIGGLGTMAGKSEVAYDDLAAALKILIDGKAAQATVDTLVGEDTGKSVRTIARNGWRRFRFLISLICPKPFGSLRRLLFLFRGFLGFIFGCNGTPQ